MESQEKVTQFQCSHTLTLTLIECFLEKHCNVMNLTSLKILIIISQPESDQKIEF
jgi:hypothetical protein